MSSRSQAAVGFTVKSGWASGIVLTRSGTSLRVEESCHVELSDPALPASRQPYHDGFATQRARGPELSRLLASVKRYGRRSVTGWIRRCQAAEHDLRGAAVVVGSLIDPASIGNEHIRIHALEGQLFREVVTDAIARTKLPFSVWRERDIYAFAESSLGKTAADIRARLTALGRSVEGEWRAEQKAATLAAWLILAAAHRRRGTGTARDARSATRD